jgi:flavin-dependent dehydrogenase
MTVHNTSQVSEYDVIVVGGGPGGSVTAIFCAQRGLRVALVERDAFPREHAGETLHPGVEPLLESLGVFDAILAANFLRHEGHWVQWGRARTFEPFGKDQHGPWRGFQAWRADFDAILLERARELGVTTLQPCRAIQPLVKAGRVVGVATSHGTLSSPFVVDAAGSRHWLARQLRLNLAPRSPRLIALYGYVEGDCAQYDAAPAIVADENGWTWMARVRPRLYQWTRLATHRPKLHPHQPWLPEDFRTLQPKGKLRGADVTWRIVNPAAGAGYFLVGDAAAVLDPASSHGVLRAIMTGIMSGHLISLVLGHEASEQQATQQYCHWVSSWFEHDCEKMRGFYSARPVRRDIGEATPR